MKYYSSQDFDHLVMEKLPGSTLESVGADLSNAERESIADEVVDFTLQLRQLRNDDIDAHLFLRHNLPSGLSNATDLGMQRIKGYSGIEAITNFIRDRTQPFDRQQNVFTHGDLDWGNILITDKKVSSIVDLECAGFLPPCCEWIAVKRLSDNHPWFKLLEPRLKSPEWNSMWEVEWLISALSKHSHWALTPQDRAANQSEGWTQVSDILGPCIQDAPLVTYAIRSKHPWWLEHKQNENESRIDSELDG
jgi:aminoglycoside phosphotransferase (APT) family kinase protein